jgi:tRNA threonylcarbamoyl adenosine modification protein (Sua5/YciO/YrdC/YwlC family)
MGRVSEEEGAGYRRFDCADEDPVVVEEAAEAARSAIERGECIVLPTDTVYGIGADAFSAEAVQRLLDAKGRGRDMPPPVLISDASLLRALAADVPQAARDLVQRHWPGPLTIICKAQPSLRMDLGDTEGTIALRVPDDGLARDVLRRTGPMAVSSANLSGQRAAVTCDEAVDQLGDRVAVYLDGGARPWHGEPSTIVDFASSPAGIVLRKGALSITAIRQTCPSVIDPDEPALEAEPEPVAEPEAESEPQPAPVWSKDAGYAAAPEPTEKPLSPSTGSGHDVRPEPVEGRSGEAAYHEPTTDELGITHTMADPGQPSLFEREDGPDAAAAPDEPERAPER